MTNLLEETIEVLSRCGQGVRNITFIGSLRTGHSCTWEEFEVLADREYDGGYGTQEVAEDLVICFNNGDRLERREYDGSEWWKLVAVGKIPRKTKPIKTLFAGDRHWSSLEDMNKEDAV